MGEDKRGLGAKPCQPERGDAPVQPRVTHRSAETEKARAEGSVA